MEQYNKLVRDRIPDIIQCSGRTPNYRRLNDKEYIKELDKKLQEELSEYYEARSLEELADVIEVLYALCEANGNRIEELELIRQKKAEERGAFKEKLYLESVE